MSNNGQSAKRASFSGKIGYVLLLQAQQSAWEISGDSRIWLRNMEGESSFSFIWF